MFDIALLVFREGFGAALIVSLIAAATRGMPRRAALACGGIACGVAGAIVVATCSGSIRNAWGDAGPAVFQAVVLLTAAALIGRHAIRMCGDDGQWIENSRGRAVAVKSASGSVAVLLVAVALLVMRKSSAIVLLLYGMAAGGAGASRIFADAAPGLAGCVAFGCVLYFGLLRIPARRFFGVTRWMLAVLAAGLVATAAGFLIRANLIPAWGAPLWNTSRLLGGGSIAGEAVHVLTGYVPRPAGIQMIFWAASLVVLYAGMRVMPMRATSAPSLRAGVTASSCCG
jgi:high-affinity iron transporter